MFRILFFIFSKSKIHSENNTMQEMEISHKVIFRLPFLFTQIEKI